MALGYGTAKRRGGVLLIDRSSIARQLLGLLLAPRFERVIEAGDCAHAARVLADEGPFDVAVVDLEAQGDPLAFIERLREQPLAPAVLATTWVHDLERETQLTMSGAVGVLTKPVTARALFRALRGLDGRAG
jgi:CheY-like chemotaxis protein